MLVTEFTLAVSHLDLTQHIRDVPDFPSPGILFRDITPMLQRPPAFQFAVDQMAEKFADTCFDAIVGIESRGFLFAAPLSYKLGIPLVPVRKQGKLPFVTNSVSYELEYGSDAIEVHVDAIPHGHRVLIVDDLLATGGDAGSHRRAHRTFRRQRGGSWRCHRAIRSEWPGRSGRVQRKVSADLLIGNSLSVYQ